MPLRRRFVVLESLRAETLNPCSESNQKTSDPAAALDRNQVTANYAVANLRRRSRTCLHCGKTHGLDIRNQALAMMAPSLRPVSSSAAVGGVLGALRPGGESAVYLQGVHLDGIRFLFAGDNR